ncbi:MAG: hypothetical protein K2W82_05440 [Candidatus Obscuribacterales bacterium]|nr:hypothetical protein [Candidatus Obscuribacterales bacterium]
MTDSSAKETGCPMHQGQGAEPSPVSYNSYLKVNELKQLQVCLSDPAHHDEPLFIVIHQSYELWFKLILHELDAVAAFIKADQVRKATFLMRRTVAIMQLLVQQIHILETMSPKDFLGFRYNLSPASGFQSSQFRELEFFCNLKSKDILEHFKSEPLAYVDLKKRYEAPSLKDLFYDLLRRRGFKLPETPAGANEAERSARQDERTRELVRLFEEEDRLGDLLDLAEVMIDLDQQIFLWRTNHVTVVERMLGFKRGTGGSEGVAYLRSTLDKRCFPELWQMRTYLQDPSAPQDNTCPMGKN